MQETEKKHHAWLVMIGCCFMMAGGLGAVLDASGVFVNPVCEDLGVGRGDFMVYLTVYFLTTIVAMPIVGHILPRYNIRVVLSVAFILTALAVGMGSVYTEVWMWYISGFVYGLAGSFIFVIPVPILITNWFHKRTGLILGITMCFSGIGGAILAPVFTQFIESFGWRNAYWMAAIVMAVLVLPWTLFVFRFKPEDMGLKPYGWTPEEEAKRQARDKERGLASSNTAGVPAKLAVKSIPFVCMFLLCGLISYYASLGTQMPQFAISIDYTPMFGATIISAMMIGNFSSKIVMGFVTDLIGVHKALLIQLGMVLLGFAGFLFFNHIPALLLVSAFLFGVQNSIYAVSTPLLIRRIFGDRDYTKIFTWARIGTGAIGCLGPVGIGYMFDFTGSYILPFLIGVGIAVICFILVIVAEATKKRLTWVEE
ncbi:MAG: MFS transporter [Coriobacteriales bacterium]|jgi:MFS family permease|nr:MFS transporter [Coriobacteriales bacterium]